MEETHKITHTCQECSEPVKDDQRYCHSCGTYLSADAITINIFNNQALRQIFTFYFLYLFICLLVKHTSYFNNYDDLVWIEFGLAALTLRFVWLNRLEMKPILTLKHLRWTIFIGVIAAAVVSSCLVSLAASQVNISFFDTDISYYRSYRIYAYPILIMLYSIALTPAIFEELAFRGVMYNYCATFLDERLVVAVTAFLFAIMHLSLLSLVWLIPFGFFIGHLRRKYNTIWYGVVFHFIFNLTACMFDLYRQGELAIFF